MPNLGVPELLIVLVIVAMLFGVGKLPQVFGAVGKGIREFRRESSDVDAAAAELHKVANQPASVPPATPVAPGVSAAAGAPVVPAVTGAPSPEVPVAQPTATIEQVK